MTKSSLFRSLFTLLLTLPGINALAADTDWQVIELWPAGEMPCSVPVDFTENTGNGQVITEVSVPALYFCPAAEKTSDATVIICPGGAYECLVIEKEGFHVAEYFNKQGMNAFVLKYRLKQYKQPAPLADVQRAIRMVRKDADKYGINPDKIGIMGFSAGGHLAASASTMFDDKVYELADDKEISARPNFSILAYPVITMGPETNPGSKNNLLGSKPSEELVKQYSCQARITDQTPPTFMVFTSDDSIVPVANGIMYYQALVEHKINAEFHIYNKGPHGFGIDCLEGCEGLTVKNWNITLTNWLKQYK